MKHRQQEAAERIDSLMIDESIRQQARRNARADCANELLRLVAWINTSQPKLNEIQEELQIYVNRWETT